MLNFTVLRNITPFIFVNGHHHSATTLQMWEVSSSEMFLRIYETTRRIHPNCLYIYTKLHGVISQEGRNLHQHHCDKLLWSQLDVYLRMGV